MAKRLSDELAALRERLVDGTATEADRALAERLGKAMLPFREWAGRVIERGAAAGIDIGRIARAGRAPDALGIPPDELLDMKADELLDVAENHLTFAAALEAARERGRRSVSPLEGPREPGEAMRQRMAERGWSAEKLAEKAGCSPRTVRRYLAGETKLQSGNRQELAKALEISTDDVPPKMSESDRKRRFVT